MWWGREGLLPVEFPWVEGSGAEREGGLAAWPSQARQYPFPPDPSFWPNGFVKLKRCIFLNLKSNFCIFARNNHPVCLTWIFEFLKIWWKWVFLLQLPVEFSSRWGKRFQRSRPVRISARVDFAAAATRVRADRLLQLYHSAPISWTRVNKRQRSCRFRRLQAEKVRHDPSTHNCMSSVSIFEVKMVKLSSVSPLFFPWCVPACGSLVGPLPDRRSGHVTWARVPIPSTAALPIPS